MHWRKRHRVGKLERILARAKTKKALKRAKPSRGAVVTMIRTGPRKLDDDNVSGGFKHIRDGIADALGVDDGSAEVQWKYAQEPGKGGARVEIVLSDIEEG